MTSYGTEPSASGAQPAASPSTEWREDEAEREALLLQRPTPCVERCLFVFPLRRLWEALWFVFFMHLSMEHKLKDWGNCALNMLVADVLYVVLFLLACTLTAVSIFSFNTNGTCGVLQSISNIYFLGLLTWYCMLKISILHGNPPTCWACTDEEAEAGFHDDIAEFASCWAWLPKEMLWSFAGLWWRPWWFILNVLPKAAQGVDITSGDDAVQWWQMREVILGSTLQPSIFGIAYMYREMDTQDWRPLLMAVVTGTLCIIAVPFYLTTAPVVQFWAFIWEPWRLIFAFVLDDQEIQLTVGDQVILFVTTWIIIRLLYTTASMRMEEWSARKKLDEGLKYAMEHPFRAELEHNFADTGCMGDVEAGQPGVLRRTVSQITGGVASSSSSSPENMSTLKAKRVFLTDFSRAARGNTATMPSCLRLAVKRTDLLEDSFKLLLEKPITELLAPSMSVAFDMEMGADAGGLTRDWFDAVAKAIMNGADDVKGDSLLAIAPDQTLVPRPVVADSGDIGEEGKKKLRALFAVGRFLALAVNKDQPLPLSFGSVLCKHLLGAPVGLIDVQRLDPDFYRGRVASVLKNGGLQELEDALGEPLLFTSAPTELRPHVEDLKENGSQIIVTDENKIEYVQLLCEAHLCGGIRRELQCVLTGFWELLPRHLLQSGKVNPRELSLLISGTRILDPDDWKSHADTQGREQVIAWFWDVVKSLDEEQRCMLLHFSTGSSRLPPAGFIDLQPKFRVFVHPGSDPDRLPVAHTCSNQIDLQDYRTKEQLGEKLKIAIYTETFEMA